MGRGVAIGLGVVAGGSLGAAARPAVVYAFWLRGSDADTVGALVFASAGIGLTVGVIATLGVAMAVTGALSGGGGSLLQGRLRGRRPSTASES